MRELVSFSVGELALKGKNKKEFTSALIRDVRRALRDLEIEEIFLDQGKYYIVGGDNKEIINRIRKVFGISSVSLCYETKKDWEIIKRDFVKYIEGNFNAKGTFKVVAKRADKNFSLNSMEINRELGAVALQNFPDLKVDVVNPDMEIFIDIKKNVYFYNERILGSGGLPVGSSGKGICLLSGGIDSPVAFYLMAKRGLRLNATHFHSYPFTSERAQGKAIDLAKIISRYVGDFKIYSVNMLEIYQEIRKNTLEKYTTILARRFMMRISERIAHKEGAGCLVTGESLGQVASQTLGGINATNSSVSIPILRPLIGMDKTEIINIAKDIASYEKSIEPHEDCCYVFSPKHPITNPHLEDVIKEEEKLNVEGLIEEAVNNMEIIYLN